MAAEQAGARGLTPAQADHRPRIRIAGPPFPSPLYASVPHDRGLGDHHYLPYLRTSPPRGVPEVSRGTFYTKRAGFIDLAHLRKTVDWAAYLAARAEAALRAGEAGMAVRFTEPDRYRLTFHYPPEWRTLTSAEREEIIPELALRIAQRATYVSVTWHEILTWYGYKGTVIIPERMSAFCFEDVMSHLVGLKVAGDAIRDPDRAYNEAVTVALDREIAELEKVTGPEKAEILARVEGNWWSFAQARKRMLNTGFPKGDVQGWLVRGLDFDPPPQPKTYTVPAPGIIRGRDFRGFLSVEMDPRAWQWFAIRKNLPVGTEKVDPERHFPLILAGIKAGMEEKFGPYAAVPYPANPLPEANPRGGGVRCFAKSRPGDRFIR